MHRHAIVYAREHTTLNRQQLRWFLSKVYGAPTTAPFTSPRRNDTRTNAPQRKKDDGSPDGGGRLQAFLTQLFCLSFFAGRVHYVQDEFFLPILHIVSNDEMTPMMTI